MDPAEAARWAKSVDRGRARDGDITGVPAELRIALGPPEALSRVDDRLPAFAGHVTANGPAPPVPARGTR
ncbi:hypothetical protein H480_41010 [Amycolatopsis vancoresmycina DSM 44592]|uniref:Uncharacterized protein n=1 Tax=Amycolatopsis vancoresmycina DSM 44592 TaxID=1292037 RepID=R1FKU1_9PSEU|nr:hypothetical protein H480_41010 [Amycolatopsis vancoresmycina DSM 44592]